MKSSEIRIFSIILVGALILVGLALMPMYLQQQAERQANNPIPRKDLKREELVNSETYVKGSPKAPVTIVVFSDFQCPSCKESVPEVHDILDGMGDGVNLAFHHFQVKPDHRFSRLLSRAAEAAGKQGKFWEMHDAIFEKQKSLVEARDEKELLTMLSAIAKTVGLDMFRYETTMAKQDDSRFKTDVALGEKLGLKGTPTYFIIDPKAKPEIRQYNSTRLLLNWADESYLKPTKS